MKTSQLRRNFHRNVISHRHYNKNYTNITKKQKSIIYDILNCPPTPPVGYPHEWPILNILNNWNIDDVNIPSSIHEGVCRFNAHGKGYIYAQNYRKSEVPFILTHDDQILAVSNRWKKKNYLPNLLGNNKTYRTEYSTSNHFMFHRVTNRHKPYNWTQPTSNIYLTYEQWYQKAKKEPIHPHDAHWYFRFNTELNDNKLYTELPFFQPVNNSFYIVNPKAARGINCRFGMMGNIAELHYDGSRNFIVLLGGKRRYILSRPKYCRYYYLYPPSHPSWRHSRINWNDLDSKKYPNLEFAKGNEIILHEGEALYLPTNWFHLIVSLGINWQCNARSGRSSDYDRDVKAC